MPRQHSPHQSLPQKGRDFIAIYRLIKRTQKLEGLIAWANRKRLTGVRNAYEMELNDRDWTLMLYRQKNGTLVALALWLFAFQQQLFSVSRGRYKKRATRKSRKARRHKKPQSEMLKLVYFVSKGFQMLGISKIAYSLFR